MAGIQDNFVLLTTIQPNQFCIYVLRVAEEKLVDMERQEPRENE
jgi:hypothetical protein